MVELLPSEYAIAFSEKSATIFRERETHQLDSAAAFGARLSLTTTSLLQLQGIGNHSCAFEGSFPQGYSYRPNRNLSQISSVSVCDLMELNKSFKMGGNSVYY